jgi:NADPH:quinone reductase-like Zn-dependent oxidoreductase
MLTASLNYRDLLMVKGQYNPKQKLPLIPLSDGVGIVEEVGEHVTRVDIGDRVAGLFATKWLCGPADVKKVRDTLGGPLDGTLSEYRVFHESSLVKVPDYLTDLEASTLPCAALTAFHALICSGNLKPGDEVLVQGTGGVSLFALLFAKMVRARVIVLSRSHEKLERAKDLGADEIICTKDTPDWAERVKHLSASDGVDHVVEVGGTQTLEQSLKAIKMGGRISMIGMLSGALTSLNVIPILMKQVTIQGILVGSREQFETMNRALELNRISIPVDRVFEFEEAIQAFHYLESASHFGKVCIQISA